MLNDCENKPVALLLYFVDKNLSEFVKIAKKVKEERYFRYQCSLGGKNCLMGRSKHLRSLAEHYLSAERAWLHLYSSLYYFSLVSWSTKDVEALLLGNKDQRGLNDLLRYEIKHLSVPAVFKKNVLALFKITIEDLQLQASRNEGDYIKQSCFQRLSFEIPENPG